ncbi:MAG: tetratricopeptide repeat protein [Anaerolineae bacterium]
MAFEDRIRLPTLSLIHRRLRLLNLLSEFVETGKRLITVYAPSGYGKSILLADFAQTTDWPVCWCSLDTADRDPAAFLTLLAYSITDRFHEIEPASLLELIKHGDTESVVRRIAEVLESVGPHILIIDDFHKANSAGVALALSRMLEQLPEHSRLILAARGNLGLDTRQVIELLVTERAAGLSEVELRFTPEELQLLMRKRFGRQIDLRSAEKIAQATDGNVAQILLTGHLMHAERLIDSLQQRLGDDREVIYSYLAEEVLSKQRPELQHFMLHTAVLPDMTADICNDLLGISDAQSYIEELVHKDLFISQIGASFRYHELFAEFLRSRLALDAARQRQVLIRAAELLATRARFDEAVPLYLRAQAWPQVVELLEAQARSLYDTGRALTLGEWLAQIPDVELQRRPRLLLWRGRILCDDLHDAALAIAVSNQARTRFMALNDVCGVAEASVLQSVALRVSGEVVDSLRLADEAVQQLQSLDTDTHVLAYAIRNRGLARATAGDMVAALDDLRVALELYEKVEDTYRIGLCHHDLGVCLCRRGNISAAEYHFQQAIRIWEKLDSPNNLANTLNSLGVSLYMVGRLEEALQRLEESLNVAQRAHTTRRVAFALASIGDVHLERRAYQAAMEAYAMSTALAREIGIRSLEVYNLIKTGEALYYQSDLSEALRLAIRAREIATEAGFTFELGLACALQARILVRQGEYETSSQLYQMALEHFTRNDVLEQARVYLWWAHSLLMDLRPQAALGKLQEATKLTLGMGDLIAGLASTVAETRQLLLHVAYRGDTPAGLRNNVQLLLAQDREGTTARAGLQVFLLGTPTLVVGGERRLFSQRGRVRRMPEFLAYLLVRTRQGGCRWYEASDAIWPDVDADKASILFHQTVKRLRDGVFGAYDYIIVQDDYYQINPQYLEWCDIWAFEQLFERALKVPAEQALDVLLELIGLYQGEFLAGFEVGDWGAAYRATCENRLMQCLRLAGEQLLKQGASQEALRIVGKGLALDFFQEELHHIVLRAYAQLGLFDQMTSHYAELERTFKRELGCPPDPSTSRLYQELMARRVTR